MKDYNEENSAIEAILVSVIAFLAGVAAALVLR